MTKFILFFSVHVKSMCCYTADNGNDTNTNRINDDEKYHNNDDDGDDAPYIYMNSHTYSF